jgi:glucose-6-phosphate isomerase
MSMKYSSSEASAAWTLKCTDLAQFDALQAQAELFRNDDKLHLRNLCNDTARCASLTGTHTSKPQLLQQQQGGQQNNQQAAGHQQHQHRKIVLDYSRQRVMGETMELLFDLADAVGLTDRREAFRTGQRINLTENQPVIHHFLRKPYFDEQEGDAAAAASILALHEPPVFAESRTARARRVAETQAVMRLIHKARQEVKTFTELVRNGVFTSVTNRPLCNTLVIALGGFQLGPEFVYKALEHHPVAAAAAAGRKIRFLSNVDPTEFVSATCDLDAAETLVVIIDKSFASADVMLIARTCQDWLVHNLATTRAVGEVGGDEDNNNIITEQDIVEKHMIAVSCQISRCVQFGIPKENVYTIWEWINPTYSLCSAAGLLPLALQFSFAIMEQVMNGAHDMDEHFFHAPLRDNIPVILGLLGVWNSTFLQYTSRAVLPYSHALSAFPAWIQHVEMSSNGKRVALDGTRVRLNLSNI